ncbi:MAG: M42 family metallopeptidase [Ruminococcaceae bacterium]|nr:M42 family metallopeptidase [Oscillospiraceae bacterium]
MIELLKKLMLTHGVSGREDKICELIRKEVEPYCDEVTVDAVGNLIAHKKGNGKKIMLGAHMDEIGYFATHIEKNGNIRLHSIGGINYTSSAFGAVVSENGVYGVLVPNAGADSPKEENVYIDIGAKTEKQARAKVKIGDAFVSAPSIRRLSGNRYIGRPFDDRVGCLVLIEALKAVGNTDNDLYFVFTTQEEVGSRGARPATYGIAPEIAIAIDVTRADEKGTQHKLNIDLGKGPTIKIKDGSVICSSELLGEMREIADANGVKYQDEMLSDGGTDTSVMQIAGKGCKAGAISIPCGYIHTCNEMIDLNDVRGAIRLATLICERI